MANTTKQSTQNKSSSALALPGRALGGFSQIVGENLAKIGRSKIGAKAKKAAKRAGNAVSSVGSTVLDRARSAPLFQRKSPGVKAVGEVWGTAVKGPALAAVGLGALDSGVNETLKDATGGIIGGTVEASDLALLGVTAARLFGADEKSPKLAKIGDDVTSAVITKWGWGAGAVIGDKTKAFVAQVADNRAKRTQLSGSPEAQSLPEGKSGTSEALVSGNSDAKPEPAEAPKKAAAPKGEKTKS